MVSTLLLNSHMKYQAKLVALTKESDSPFDVLSQAGIGEIKFARLGEIAVTNIALLSRYLGVSPAILNNFTTQYATQFSRLGLQYVRSVDQVTELYKQLGESDRAARATLSRYNCCRFLSRRCVFVLALVVKSSKGKDIREKAALPTQPFSIQDIWRALGFDPDPISATTSKTAKAMPKAKVPSTKKSQAPSNGKTPATNGASVVEKTEPVSVEPVPAVLAETAPPPSLSPWSVNSLPLKELVRLRRADAQKFRELADRLDAEAKVLEDADNTINAQFGGWYEVPSPTPT